MFSLKRCIKQLIFSQFNLGLSTNYTKFLRNGGKIGENCEIFPNVEFGSEPYLITIGNNVRITNGVKFVTHDNVHIGWNEIIMPNVKIGDNCVIGAGAVVTKDIPNNSIAVGIPARVIETVEEYEEKVLTRCDYTKSLTYSEKKAYLLEKFKRN